MQEMRIYLLNNTNPYREGEEEYSGAGFNFPVDFEDVREKIGVEHEEQIEIADYELPFDLHSDMPLWEINANCRMVLELEGTPIGYEMKAIQQKWFSSFEEFIDHKDEIRYYDVGDGAALAEYLIREEYVFGEIPHELLKHIDYHSYGSELEMDDRYLFHTSGIFRYQYRGDVVSKKCESISPILGNTTRVSLWVRGLRRPLIMTRWQNVSA